MADTEAFDAAVTEAEAAVDSLPFCGEQIAVKPLPAISLLKFAKMATRDVGTGDMEGMAAMYDMIRGVVLPHELGRFEQLAQDNEVTGEQLMEFVVAVLRSATGRPTKPSSSSPTSVSDASQKSKSGSVVDLGDGRIVEIQPGETTAAATARALLLEMDEDDEDLAGIEQATKAISVTS